MEKSVVRPIDGPILERLGQFIVYWSLLENSVADLFVATISSGIENLMIVTQSVSASTISNWIRTMINFRPTPINAVDEIHSILNEYDELRAERNCLVHGLWGTDKSDVGTVMVQTIHLDRNVVVLDRLLTANDLDDLINASLALYDRVRVFMQTNELPYRGVKAYNPPVMSTPSPR